MGGWPDDPFFNQCKGGSVEETLIHNSKHKAKFEFSFPVTLCLSF